MKKITLIPLAFAAFGVIAAPAFAEGSSDYQSQRNSMDSPESIKKAYKEYDETMKEAAHDGHASEAASDYSRARENMDSPEHIKKAYKHHHQAMDEAAHDGHHSGAAPDYEATRRGMDDPDHVNEAVHKVLDKKGGTGE